MAHFEEHCSDCERFLGDRCEDVNRWLDQAFHQFGPRHRFVKHHQEGVKKAFELFGERGRKAALIHILKDCGHIPTERMYAGHMLVEEGEVDWLGIDPQTPFNGYWDPHEFNQAVQNILRDQTDGQRSTDSEGASSAGGAQPAPPDDGQSGPRT